MAAPPPTRPLPVQLEPASQYQRRRQYRTYHGNLACQYCPYRTEHRTNLVAHQRTHTGERPFRCEVCSRGFCQKGNLKLHMRRHSAEPGVQCPVCPRRFSNKYGLHRHIQQNHSNHLA
ncbi:uncharacterized protein LOC144175056 [Haemaphysalis longicornis]